MDYMQKAWFYNEYGPRAVLQYGDFPVPQLGDTQVLVRVRAAALNPVDFKLRNGVFKDTGLEFPVVPGCDVAGVIVDEGDNVSMFSKGDEVYGNIQSFNTVGPKQYGTLTQYTAVEESLIALKPENMSFEEAASFPLALQTAQEGFDRAKFQRGQTVFIVGGEGGVGSLAIQLANSSPHPRAEFYIVTPSGSNLERLRSYIECEKLKPVIDPTGPYAFSNVMEAFKHLESGRARGKVVISPID
uniref:Enoyl reductase (ER) domain-containing protein n=1 Tax=Picea sitchensis TaxID=3332 RepID=A9NR38_PICSI|nr:unknown [Picea sitchensis]